MSRWRGPALVCSMTPRDCPDAGHIPSVYWLAHGSALVRVAPEQIRAEAPREHQWGTHLLLTHQVLMILNHLIRRDQSRKTNRERPLSRSALSKVKKSLAQQQRKQSSCSHTNHSNSTHTNHTPLQKPQRKPSQTSVRRPDLRGRHLRVKTIDRPRLRRWRKRILEIQSNRQEEDLAAPRIVMNDQWL